ncbi:MAG: tetratricopeptide repeat protein [Pseudomonadota bacterium]
MKRLIIILALSLLGLSSAVAQDAPIEPPSETGPAPVAPAVVEGPEASFNQALELLERHPFPSDETLDQVEPLLDIAYKGRITKVEIPYNLGVIAFRRGRLEEAVRYFRDAKVLDPSGADIIAMLGMISARQGRDADAESLMQEALAVDEYSSVALNYSADKEIKARNFDAALVFCRKGLLGNPDNLDSYLNMAIVYYETDRLELGELVCQSALKINKEAAPIRNLLGLIYLKQNEVRKAFSEFERAVTADSGYTDARKNLAALVLNYKDYVAAVTQFEEALKLNPDDLQLRLSYSVALRGVGNFDGARTELEGILAKQPGHLEASYNLCILLHEYLESYEAALRQCSDFQARIDKKHAKWRELSQRVKGIRETIDVLKEFPEDKPAPEGEVEPAPEGEVKPGPEGEVEPAPEGEDKPAPEGEVKPGPEGEVEPAPEGEVKPAPEGETKTDAEGGK